MAKYAIRYKAGQAPQDADGDTSIVEAAMFQTKDDFIDFYSESAKNVGGTYNAKGRVVTRVSKDVVADIREVEA